jgi:phage terminase small subunit
MALTKKEKAFCEAYVANGGNSSRAYAEVYECCIEDARKRYCKTFRKPEIKEYIRELQKVAFDNACITAERVALRLSEIAFADREDEIYTTSAQLKALDLLQKQLGLQHQKIEAEVSTDIVINIEE